MSEFISGSETEFVAQMNERAKGLGMENTHFVNCNGLDTDGHETTARDIALMSRELITTYPQIRDYCMIWMENITHTTKKGTSEFGLTNTNKLIRQYQYATGLKTGSTSKAKFCLSATAEKDGMELIAVIMAANDGKARIRDATALLGYGFGKCRKYEEEQTEKVKPVPVKRGVKTQVQTVQKEPFAYVDTTGVRAPLKKVKKVGEAAYYLNGAEIGKVDILTAEAVKEVSLGSVMGDMVKRLLL